MSFTTTLHYPYPTNYHSDRIKQLTGELFIMSHYVAFFACVVFVVLQGFAGAVCMVDVSDASVVLDVGSPKTPVKTAVRVLTEEIQKRTGLEWQVKSKVADAGTYIVLKLDRQLPAEGFSIALTEQNVVITGADARGLLYGVGHFLRHLDWQHGKASYKQDEPEITSSPAYPIRGHQLGYRNTANSYDMWDVAQYEQYIRELALFGANSIENIPFQDGPKPAHMPLKRADMNVRMSAICAEYGLDYWIWTPAVFDLSDEKLRAEHLKEHECLYRECEELTGVFFPGGDPGANPPELVLPFMEDLAKRLNRHHPKAKVWLSLQWFTPDQCEDIYRWIETEKPEWFGGLVSGPGSPSVPDTRARLAKDYPVRHYPDITHTVRCQYPVPWWDPAFAVTLGREPINPQPVFYAFIHNNFAPYTDGFITYSDGIHDDLNKAVWSLCGWNPEYGVREILIEYARFFFGPTAAEQAADGILALEKNWEGPLAENGGVQATLALWQELEAQAPELKDNWRWQTFMVRAYYDAYTRHRLLYETHLEDEVNEVLSQSNADAEAAITTSLEILNKATAEPCQPELCRRIVELFDDLYKSIGFQTSVDKYQASGYERGCSLDFLDYPLNNRWWLEDEFEKIRAMTKASEKIAALKTLASWEYPGKGSFYDNIGHVGQCPHLKRTEGLNTDPLMERAGNPEAAWKNNGFNRARLSWQTTMNYPLTLVYEGLDKDATYTLRISGQGEARPRANGYALIYSRYEPRIKDFPVPQGLTAGGKLIIEFDPLDESHLNWRQHSHAAEVWLLKQ